MTLRSITALTCLLLAVCALAPAALAQPGGGPPPPQALPAPPVPAQNPITAEKAVLGKMLFWDEQLSSDGTIACGTCHIPAAGGSDPRLTGTAANPGPDGVTGTADDVFGSPGVLRANAFGHYSADATFGFGVQATGRTSQSTVPAAYFRDLFWDGRASRTFTDPVSGAVVIPNGGGLESQSLGPIVSDVEMGWEGRSWTDVVERLETARPLRLATDLPGDVAAALAVDPEYPALFQRAFGTPEITPVRIAFALATYQRTLVPDQSKFDRVARGQAQFTQAEMRGWGAFNNQGSRCSVCHGGALLSDDLFHNLGIRPINEDAGRFDVTGNFGDRGRFKTPSLRNVALRERYFHTGFASTLPEVVAFYDGDGGAFNQNKDPLLTGINIPPGPRADIVTFLGTLTDPRVATETFPFDRPTLRSERPTSNPQPIPIGAVAGAGGFEPQITAVAPPVEGFDGFGVGLHGALGGQFSVLHVQLLNIPAGATTLDLRNGLPLAQTVQGAGTGNGFATWRDTETLVPALVGLSFDAQWWIRDFAAQGGVAKSNWVRITIEPR